MRQNSKKQQKSTAKEQQKAAENNSKRTAKAAENNKTANPFNLPPFFYPLESPKGGRHQPAALRGFFCKRAIIPLL